MFSLRHNTIYVLRYIVKMSERHQPGICAVDSFLVFFVAQRKHVFIMYVFVVDTNQNYLSRCNKQYHDQM